MPTENESANSYRGMVSTINSGPPLVELSHNSKCTGNAVCTASPATFAKTANGTVTF